MRWLLALGLIVFCACQGCCGCRPGLFGPRYYYPPPTYQQVYPGAAGCVPCQ